MKREDMPGRLKGCSRGVFALKSWAPLRKPGEPIRCTSSPSCAVDTQQEKPSENRRNVSQPRPAETEKQNSPSSNNGKKDPRIGRSMKAKYNYSANPASPIGHELSVKQFDEMVYMEECADNPEWWLVENSAGDKGFVPKSYMKLDEPKQTSLPWLQNHELVEEKPKDRGSGNAFGQPKEVAYKPYRSAYDQGGEKTEANSNYRCDMCDKNLNGPQPYRAHMLSKAHKEMVEYMEES